MTLKHLNPSELPDWTTLFSQVVVGEGSPLRIVVVSGQVGVDEDQVIEGDGSFAAQVARAFANLVIALGAGRCSVADVAKLTIATEALGSHQRSPERPSRRCTTPARLLRSEIRRAVDGEAVSSYFVT